MTIGIVLAAAFFYPFLPGRRGRPSLWETSSQPERGLAVLLVGGSIGLALIVTGVILLNWQDWFAARPGKATGATDEDNHS